MPNAVQNSGLTVAAAGGSWWRVLAWGLFLGCSWTWVIGMYLPVILARDFGPLAFWAFAVPNVVGAALMGVLLARGNASALLVRRHARAAWWFSAVTLAFHWYVLFWMLFGTGNMRISLLLLITAIVGQLLAGYSRGRGDRGALIGSGATWLVSAGLIVWWALDRTPATTPLTLGGAGEGQLLWMAPVMILGFLTCPFLDLTFHEARQKLPGKAGSLAFVLGFGFFFLAMILATRAYGTDLLAAADGKGGLERVIPGLAPLAILLHLALQTGFTAMLHRSWVERGERGIAEELGGETKQSEVSPLDAEVLARLQPSRPREGFRMHPVSTISLVGGAVVGAAAMALPGYAGLNAGEVLYRLFMAFYGLVFPAYVWIVMLPRGGRLPQVHTALRVCAVAVLIASPMYWMGFIERQTWWLAPGVLVILLAKLVPTGGSAAGSRPRLVG